MNAKPEGTPVERWLSKEELEDGYRGPSGSETYTLRKTIERLCALLDATNEVLTACRATSGQHLKEAQGQRTRAERFIEAHDTVMVCCREAEKERDQLRRDHRTAGHHEKRAAVCAWNTRP